MLFFLRFNKSFLKIFIIKDIGVTTVKKIANITIGEIKFPIKIPNLNQNLFNGVKIFELNNAKIKKIRDMVNNQTLTLPL